MNDVLTDYDYEEIKKIIVSVFEDYGVSSFPVNTKKLAEDMGCLLIPYSNFEIDDRELLIKFSEDGFSRYDDKLKRYIIWYNDAKPSHRQRFTFAHEIIHIIREHFDLIKNHKQENEANFGAGYMLAPTICYKFIDYTNPYEIMNTFGIGMECAVATHNRFVSRKGHSENKIYEYERKIISLFFKNKI